jgi:hypothetical protein
MLRRRRRECVPCQKKNVWEWRWRELAHIDLAIEGKGWEKGVFFFSFFSSLLFCSRRGEGEMNR